MAQYRGGRSPAELDQLLMQFRRWRRRILHLVLVALGLILLSSTFYQIESDSQGVLLRFGRYVATTDPGLHFKLPWPVDAVYAVPVNKIQTLDFGFSTSRPGRRTQYAPADVEQIKVASMLTGDLNIAMVEWIVQYRISDPFKYLFTVVGEKRWSHAEDIIDLIRDAAESVVRRLVGDASVDEVLTRGREQIAIDARTELQQLLISNDCGIEMVAVKHKDVTPPEEDKDAFDAGERDKQNKERVVHEARGERNRQIPAARGQRDRAITEADGYRERVVREATGRARAFDARLAAYRQAPEVTRTRLYIETMEQVIDQINELIIIDESVRGVLPLLDLDRTQRAAGEVR